jgi:uncharacterized protein (TIGR02678 family)
MSNLTNQLALVEREEVAYGIRALLAKPLLRRENDAESFEVVCRRRILITRWFDQYCGWHLAVEPRSGYARLRKVRAHAAVRPQISFDRRRYVLLCVLAAELITMPVGTSDELTDRIIQDTTQDSVLEVFDPTVGTEQSAFADVLEFLGSVGALAIVDGRYRADVSLLLRLLAAYNSPALLDIDPGLVAGQFPELLDALTSEKRYGVLEDGLPRSEVQRNLFIRHQVFRKLCDDPVVYYVDLDDAQRRYLTSPAGRRWIRNAAEQAEFVVEDRAEGVALIDPTAQATDRVFPDAEAALTLLPLLGAEGLSREEIGAAESVAALEEFGLARWEGDRLRAQPAAARYDVTVQGDDDVK